MRLILEMGIAEFLFARKTKKDIAELEILVENQHDPYSPSKDEEVAFHSKLYEMTGNETFARFQTLLMPVFEYVFSEYYDRGNHVQIPEPVIHRDLVEILKNGNADEFRKAMYTHLLPYYISGHITPRG